MRPVLRDDTGFVYLIEARIGVLKIGHGVRPYERLSAVRTHSPVPCRMISFWKGPRSEERMLHERFSAHRSHGEWFSIVGSVADLVSEKSGLGVGKVEAWEEVLFGPERRATIIANAERRRAITRAITRGKAVPPELMEFYDEPRRCS